MVTCGLIVSAVALTLVIAIAPSARAGDQAVAHAAAAPSRIAELPATADGEAAARRDDDEGEPKPTNARPFAARNSKAERLARALLLVTAGGGVPFPTMPR